MAEKTILDPAKVANYIYFNPDFPIDGKTYFFHSRKSWIERRYFQDI